MNCTKCGAKLKRGKTICEECGTRLDATSEQAVRARGKKVWIIFAIVMLAVGLIAGIKFGISAYLGQKNCEIGGNCDDTEIFLTRIENGKCTGYYKKDGSVIDFEKKYEYMPVLEFVDGKAKIKKDHRWGFVNKKGQEIIKTKYCHVSDFNNGMAIVYNELKGAVINSEGKIVIPFSYDHMEFSFQDQYIKAKIKDKWGYIDRKGDIIIPIEYDDIGEFSENVVSVCKNRKWGFRDNKNKSITPMRYDDAAFFSEGLAAVEKNDKWGYVNKKGKVVIPIKYNMAEYFEDGVAVVSNSTDTGIIDKKGKEIIPLEYESLTYYDCNNIIAKKKGKYGFINLKNEKKVPLKYKDASLYLDDSYAVMDGDNNIIILRDDKEIFSTSKYNQLGYMIGDNLLVAKKGRWGIIDKNGEEILSCEYSVEDNITDDIYPIFDDSGCCIFVRDKKVFYVMSSGKTVELAPLSKYRYNK